MAYGVMFYRTENKQQVYNCRELSLELNKINNQRNNQNQFYYLNSPFKIQVHLHST
jgi:hypothetical protein